MDHPNKSPAPKSPSSSTGYGSGSFFFSAALGASFFYSFFASTLAAGALTPPVATLDNPLEIN